MATHDYVIDNSTGANVRADLNLVLQAILSNNSSSSAPSTTAAYMWWADTTNGILKIRNSANNAWVELLQLDGTLTLEDGSASTPALAFRDDLNTGIFSSAADTFNVATGGVERMELGATTVFNEDGADVDFRIEGDSNSNLFKVDAGNDQVGIGGTPSALLHVTGNPAEIRLQHTGNGGFSRLITDSNNNLNFYVGGGPALAATLDASGRLLLGTTTEGQSNAEDLTVAGSGNSGITIRSGTSNFGQIFFSDGTSGDDEYRGIVGYSHTDNFMKFHTNATERMRIDSSGNLTLGGFAPPTDLNSAAVPSLFIDSNQNNFFGESGALYLTQNAYFNSGGSYEYVATAVASQYKQNSGAHIFSNAASGSAGANFSFLERMRIRSDGRVAVGGTGTGYTGQFGVHAATDLLDLNSSGSSTAGKVKFYEGGSGRMNIETLGGTSGLLIYDSLNAVTRVKIGSSGHIAFNKTDELDGGTPGHILRSGSTSPNMTTVFNTNASASSTYHLFNTNATNNGYRFYVQANGGIANYSGNNQNLSDEREKKNITLMGSVFNTFKQFVFKDFNYISESDSITKKHGLIAQDVELIDSDLVNDGFKTGVDSEGNEVLRKGLKEEQFMMIGFKALQEAIAKIEVLETKVAALEAA